MWVCLVACAPCAPSYGEFLQPPLIGASHLALLKGGTFKTHFLQQLPMLQLHSFASWHLLKAAMAEEPKIKGQCICSYFFFYNTGND